MKSKYRVGQIVLCPSSGPVAGPRKGEVIEVRDSTPAMAKVKYVDPADDLLGGWVNPIKVIK